MELLAKNLFGFEFAVTNSMMMCLQSSCLKMYPKLLILLVILGEVFPNLYRGCITEAVSSVFYCRTFFPEVIRNFELLNII